MSAQPQPPAGRLPGNSGAGIPVTRSEQGLPLSAGGTASHDPHASPDPGAAAPPGQGADAQPRLQRPGSSIPLQAERLAALPAGRRVPPPAQARTVQAAQVQGSTAHPSHAAAMGGVADHAAADAPAGGTSVADAITVAAFYRFSAMEQLPALRQELLDLAVPLQVRGTILLAGEGVNGTISGPEAGVLAVLQRLRRCPGLEPLEAKFSRAPQQAFHRLKVRLKREIVTMGCPTVKPAEQVGTYVPPQQWDALIRDPGTLVIDTRNAYEVAIGTFEGAIDPGTASFREFPDWVERELRPLVDERRPQAIAMFCTGGIRCEKASSYLLQQGFRAVHHLQGGILRYLEEMPESASSWRGECFVFDQRVAVNHRLEPGSHRLCHACGLPLAPADLHHPAFRQGVSCHHCIERFSDDDRARFAERQRQIERARSRGQVHVGATMPAAPAAGVSHTPEPIAPIAVPVDHAGNASVPDQAPAILYSFRRCPYAIRARLGLAAAGLRPGRGLDLREVALRSKPPELLAASAKGTVPVLVLPDTGAVVGALDQTPASVERSGQELARQPHPDTRGPAGRVLEESLAILHWAIAQRDPEGWLAGWGPAARAEMDGLIAENDGPFKQHLDRFKYADRHGSEGLATKQEHRERGLAILRRWNRRLRAGGWLLGARPSLADIALLPFVRQFRLADPAGFDAEPELEALQAWLRRFLDSEALRAVMQEPWAPRSPWRSPGWLYHLALREEWQIARAQGVYRRSTRGLSLEQVGFLHASYAHQIAATHRRFYADLPAGAVRLLTLDPARLAAAGVPVLAEPAPESGELFPHLYGALPTGAVLRDEPYPP